MGRVTGLEGLLDRTCPVSKGAEPDAEASDGISIRPVGDPLAAGRGVSHLRSLTGLRLLLVALVVTSHYAKRCGFLSAGDWVSTGVSRMGDVGVSGFFILSGYILVHVYKDRTWSVREFAINRFARIYPLYLAALLFALPLDWLTPNMPAAGKHEALVLAVFLLQSYFEFSAIRFNCPG